MGNTEQHNKYNSIKEQRLKNKRDLESLAFANQITSIIMFIVSVIGIIIIACWVWFTQINKPPTTTSNTQISTIGSDNKKTYFMEFNQLRNNNKN